MDEWGVDVAVTGSQKCLMAPAGLVLRGRGRPGLGHAARKWAPTAITLTCRAYRKAGQEHQWPYTRRAPGAGRGGRLGHDVPKRVWKRYSTATACCGTWCGPRGRAMGLEPWVEDAVGVPNGDGRPGAGRHGCGRRPGSTAQGTGVEIGGGPRGAQGQDFPHRPHGLRVSRWICWRCWARSRGAADACGHVRRRGGPSPPPRRCGPGGIKGVGGRPHLRSGLQLLRDEGVEVEVATKLGRRRPCGSGSGTTTASSSAAAPG